MIIFNSKRGELRSEEKRRTYHVSDVLRWEVGGSELLDILAGHDGRTCVGGAKKGQEGEDAQGAHRKMVESSVRAFPKNGKLAALAARR